MSQVGIPRTQLTVGRQSRLCDILGAELRAAGITVCFTHIVDAHAVRLSEALGDVGLSCVEVGTAGAVVSACTAFAQCGAVPACLVSGDMYESVSTALQSTPAVVLTVSSLAPNVTDPAGLGSALSDVLEGQQPGLVLTPSVLSALMAYSPLQVKPPTATRALSPCSGNGTDDGSSFGAMLATLNSSSPKGCIFVTDSSDVAASAAKVLDSTHAVCTSLPGDVLASACGASNAQSRLVIALVSEDSVSTLLSSEVLIQRTRAHAIVMPTNATGANYSLLATHAALSYVRAEQPAQLTTALAGASAGRAVLVELNGTPLPSSAPTYTDSALAESAAAALKGAGVDARFSTRPVPGCRTLSDYTHALQAACSATESSVAAVIAEGTPVFVNEPVVQIVLAAGPQDRWNLPASCVATAPSQVSQALLEAAASRATQTGSTFVIAAAPGATFGGSAADLPEAPTAADDDIRAVLSACQKSQARLHIASAPRHIAKLAVDVAETLGLVVTTDPGAKGVFPEDHPHCLWSAGTKVPAEMRDTLTACTTAVVIGTTTTTSIASTGLYIVSLEEAEILDESTTYITSTPAAFLQKLAAAARGTTPSHMPTKSISEARARHARATQPTGLTPASVISALQTHLPKDTVFCLDDGIAATVGAETLTVPDSSCLRMPAAAGACTLPALLGLSSARPAVVVSQGEGFLSSYLEVMQLLKASAAPQPLVVLLRSRERATLGVPYRLTGRPIPAVAVVPDFDASAAARALGGVHRRAASAADLPAVMQWGAEQLRKGNHAVVEVAVEEGDAFSTLSRFLPESALAAAGEGGQDADAARRRGRKNRALSKVQRLVHSAVEPSDYYMPIVREYDTSFAQDELARRTASDAFDIWDILLHAKASYSSKRAYAEGSHTATYAEMYRRCCFLAEYLTKEAGVKHGDRVGVITPNIYQCMEAHYAVGAARGVTLNLNQRLAAEELAYVLDNAGPVWVVASSRFAPLILDAVRHSKEKTVKGVLWVGDLSEGVTADIPHHDFEEVAAGKLGSGGGEFSPGPAKAGDGCEMYYTSGTTGRPKGVILNQRNVVMHALGCMLEHRHHAGDVWGHIAPIFHLVDAYGMFSITWVGGSHVFIPTFSAENTVSAIETHGITVTNMASTMATLILNHPGVDKRDLSSLQMLSCGGAPLSREITLRAIAVFGCEVFQSYGMTECCGKISMSLLNKPEVRELPANQQVDLVCSSGKAFALPGFEMRVVMDNGKAVEAQSGDVGEVQIRGPTVFEGYYNNPEATRESFDGDWFKTGDLATVEGHGYIVVCDRKKDMILTGGENVYSVEVERALQDHDDVKYVGVFAIPHPLMGEVVKAVVELHPGAASTSTTLRRHCSKLLADYKVPREVELIDPMPLTGTGKVAKAELKKREAARRAEREAEREARRGGGAAPQQAPAAGSCPDVLTQDTYHVTWAPQSLSGKAAVSGNWVVFTDSTGVGEAVAKRLQSSGASSVAKVSAASIDTFDKASYSAITRDTEGMVFLWPLDHSPVGGEPISAGVTQSVHVMVRSLLTIMQAAIAAGVRNTNIFVVTRGAQVDAPSVPEPCTAVHATQQALWGFARVIPAERPGFRCHVVDLCPADSDIAACAQAVSSEIASGDTSPHGESAWRARRRFVPNLQLLPMPAARQARFESDATYVVTGGLGGLGRQLARMMITRWNARHLVLVSRRKPEADVAAELKALEEAHGATIRVESADIADLAATKAFLKRVSDTMKPIKGIFHLAGIVDDGRMEDQSWERFLKTLVPKVDGSVNLHVAADELNLPLDHFVLFSSIYGVLGYRELTHYAAANAFQDGLCLARRRMGLPALAVSWGTWSDAGMASRFGSGFEAYWKGLGMEFVPLVGGMQTMGALCMMAQEGGAHHAGVFPADWERYLKQRRQLGPHPLCRALALPFQKQQGAVADPNLPALLRELVPLSPPDRQARLEKKICEMIQDIREGDDDDEEVDPTSPVVDIGLTSMHVIDLTVQIGEVTGMEDISPTIVYECVTVRAVAERLLEDLAEVMTQGGGGGASAAPAVDPNAPALVQQLQGCPPEERSAVLKKALIELTREILEDDDIEIDVSDPVVELGLTSMHVVDMTQQMIEMTGLEDLSPTFIYECVTLAGVMDLLLEELPLASAAQAPAAAAAATAAGAAQGGAGAPSSAGPLAVVGIGCRLPGDASSPAEFWANLEAELNCVVPAPGDRPSNAKPSGYLSSSVVKRFDREAFGIGGTEAAMMDPQQRLLLQVAREAFEDAGIIVEELEDRSVGVFVGVSNVEYGALGMKGVEAGRVDPLPYCGTSWHLSIAANRISYQLDLNGPSVSMDTACSSSLTAMDFALKSLNSGSCSMALVCGANIQLVETWSDCFQIAGMLSPTFSCKFGDNSADGYVRGEGVGAVLIRPLAEAQAAGDHIYAEVVGASINQDARSNGLTAPNPAAQEALLRTAYKSAHVDPSDVVYIEAHGTGTHLGDPIEMTALGRVLGAPKDLPPRERPLLLGSVKSCIGHLECAAGIAGIIKACLVLHHNRIPPSLHFNTPNQLVRFEQLGLQVCGASAGVRDLPKPSSGNRPVVGVSGFGFGGTNGHCVLRQHIVKEVDRTSLKPNVRCIVPIAAHTLPALQETCRRWAQAAKTASTAGLPTLADFAYTAVHHRHHGVKARPHRAAIVAASLPELATRLQAAAEGTAMVGAPTGQAVGNSPRVAFVFTGQGSQTVGMGRGLFETSRPFNEAMKACDAVCASKKLLPKGRALIDTLYGDIDECTAALNEAGFLQPALLSVEYSLARMVEEQLCIVPEVMMGHSLGEITACAVSGIYTLEEALTLAAVRGAAMAEVPAGQGGMAAVRLDKAELEELLPQIAPEVSVAACNAPGSSVISGPSDELKACIAKLKEKGKKVKQLVVTHGFHSSQIESALPKLYEAASKLTAKAPRSGVTVISNVTGKELTKLPDAQYWVDHARGTVLFLNGVRTALDSGINVFIELGPQPHLTVQLNGILPTHKKPAVVVSTLQAGKDEPELLASAAGALYNAGVALPWETLVPEGQRVRLPPVAMVGEEHWMDLPPTRRQLEAQRRENDPKGVVFGTEWQEAALASTPIKLSTVMLVSDGGISFSADIVTELRKTGCAVSKVTAAPSDLSVQRLTAALEERDHWDAVIFSCTTNDYIHGTAALLRLVQACGTVKRVSRLMVLTTGVCSTKPSSSTLNVSVACQAALWGFVKSARLEVRSPLLQCCDVDTPSPHTPQDVVAELRSESFGLDNVRLPSGGTGRRVERTVAIPEVPKTEKFTPPAGPVIITGGTGALGLQLSDWLMKRGCKRIILLSRRGKVADSYQGLWELVQATASRMQAEVELQVCDVSDKQQTEDMISRNATGLRTGGFIHCAGVLDDGLLKFQTEERYAKVLVPKVGGLLHSLKCMMSKGIRPPMFLLFSSVTAYMGNVGQTSYGAANAILDSIARQLTGANINCTSVQWGPWGGYGMAAFMDEGEGVNTVWQPLTGPVGWGSFDTVFAPNAEPVLCVSGFKWDNLREFMSSHQWSARYFGSMVKPLPELEYDDDDDMEDYDDESEPDAPAAEGVSPQAVESTLLDVLGKYCKNAEAIGPQTELVNLNLDSVDMTAVAQDISKKFGIKAGPMLLMECERIDEVVRAVSAQVVAQGGAKPAAAKAKAPRRRAARGPVEEEPAEAASVAMSEAEVFEKLLVILDKFGKAGGGIEASTELMSLALDSVDMTAVAQSISKGFGIKAGPMMVMEVSTVGELAKEIVKAGASTASTGAASSSKAAPRRKARKEAAASSFAPVAKPTPEGVHADLVQIIMKYAKEAIDPTPKTELVNLNLDSVDMTAVAQEVSKKFSIKAGPMFVMESETLGDLGKAIIELVPDTAPVESQKASKRVKRQPSSPTAPGSPLTPGHETRIDIPTNAKDLEDDCIVLNRRLAQDKYGSTAMWLLTFVGRLFFLALGQFISFILASLASGLPEVFTKLFSLPTPTSCSVSLGHELSFFWDVFLCALVFLPVFVCANLLYYIALKWTIIGRFKPQSFVRGSSMCSLRKDIVRFYNDEMVGRLVGPFSETEILIWWYRALGADIGKGVVISNPTIFYTDLMHIGDRVTINPDVDLGFEFSLDGFNYEMRELWIGAGSTLCFGASVVAGTQFGQATTVCVRATAQGIVPSGSTVYHETVLRPGEHPPVPVSASTTLRTTLGGTWDLVVAQVLGLLAILVVMDFALAFTVVYVAYLLVNMFMACNDLGYGYIRDLPVLDAASIIALFLTPVVMGSLVSVLAVVLKWAVLGRWKEGSHRLTTFLVWRFWFVRQVLNLAENLFVLLYFRYTPVMWLWFVALGAKFRTSAILSPYTTYNHDLIEVGDECYLGFQPYIPTLSCDHVEGIATFKKTYIRNRSFVGPSATLLAGACLESDSAVSAGGVLGKDRTVRRGTLHFGSKITVAYKPEPRLDNNIIFNVYQLVLCVLVRFPVQFLMSLVPLLVGFLFIAWVNPDWSSDLYVSLTLILCLSRQFNIIVMPFVLLPYGVATKWIFLGRIKEGQEANWRSFHHANWIHCLITSGTVIVPMLSVYQKTFLCRWFFILRGGKVGPNTVIHMPPPSPENDVMELGDGVFFENSTYYAHNFLNGYLKYEGVKVGDGVINTFAVHVTPGSTIPDGTLLGPNTLTFKGSEMDRCQVLLGTPAKIGHLGAGNTFHTDASEGILPLDPSMGPYDRTLLRYLIQEFSINALEEGLPVVGDVERQRSRSRNRSALRHTLLDESSPTEMEGVHLTTADDNEEELTVAV